MSDSKLSEARAKLYPRGMAKQSICETAKSVAKSARRLWNLRDNPEALKLEAAKIIGPKIPSRLRKIADPFDDYAGENETKIAIPFYSQLDWYSCGAIAGWAVVELFHPNADFDRFYRDCAPSPTKGMGETRLVRALRRHGIGVGIRRDLDFDAIAESIENGFPIIVGVGHEFSDGDHWVVIYGVGYKPNRVFLSNIVNPSCSHEEFTWREFKSEWAPRCHGLACWGK